jgi:hypothetical protein
MFVLAAAILGVPAVGYSDTAACSIGMVEGAWVFATGIGQLGSQPPLAERIRGKQITAIGTLNIDARGDVSGRFDQTVGDIGPVSATYTGRLTLRDDCSGSVSLITSGGTARTDSIVVVANGQSPATEIWGMSRENFVTWTYVAKRTASSPR